MQDLNPTPPNDAAKPSAAGPAQREPVTEAQLEQQYLAELAAAGDQPRLALWKLVAFYTNTRQPDQALKRLRELLPLAGGAEGEADCLLNMGRNHEQLGDFPGAIRFYRLGLALEPSDPVTCYFLNNNLGFCLNTVGRFEAGEQYCRRAIQIHHGWSNGYKNLGLALKGQGRWREAARAFVAGTLADPGDGRSSALLEHLVSERPELRAEFGLDLERCHRAVELAREQRAQAERDRLRKP